MSQEEPSYDVYVKSGVDGLGRDEFGPAVAHFKDGNNAVALKRRMEGRGEKVHVQRSTVYDLSEAEKEAWFSDYSQIPEFEPAWDQDQPENSAPTQESSGDQSKDPAVAPSPRLRTGAQEASEGRRGAWLRRKAGGQYLSLGIALSQEAASDTGSRPTGAAVQGHHLLEGSFRAISEPTTAETGEVVIWVTREEEYESSMRENRPVMGRPWPAKQMDVVFSPLEETTDQAGHKLSEASEDVREEHGTKVLLSTQQEINQEGSERPWWRRAFGGAASEVVEVTSAQVGPVGRPLEEFERYTRTKPPGA